MTKVTGTIHKTLDLHLTGLTMKQVEHLRNTFQNPGPGQCPEDEDPEIRELRKAIWDGTTDLVFSV